jgi:fused signal recognition particle receptor
MSNPTGWLAALSRTRRAAFGRLAEMLGATELGESAWEEMENLLLQADLGPELTERTVHRLRERMRRDGSLTRAAATAALRENLLEMLAETAPPELGAPPVVVLIVGVNGSGKTTTIAKLARLYQAQGKRVMLGAADTFRAAASDQLAVWADRLGLDVIAGAPDADPGAVAYDAAQAARARGADLLLVDTAGRLQNRFNLMEELKKVRRAIGKAIPGAPHHVWLVLDASTGQNALAQAAGFREAVGADGVILAKLDGSAKGGMALRIRSELGLPILFAGLGESADDLVSFDRDAFVDSLLS